VNIASKLARAFMACQCVLCSLCAFAQVQTTGRIAGEVTDIHGAVIVGAAITAENAATGERRSTTTDQSGAFGIAFLTSAEYRLSITAQGFATATYNHVTVAGSATTTLNVKLEVAPANIQVEVNEAPPVIQSSSPELATNLDERTLTSVPLPTRNFLQLAALAPGVSMPLTDNRAVGRNTPNFSVNGARFSQNSLQINGVDASDNAAHDLGAVAIPAPESIREVVVQTSMYDASITGAGGGSVQVTTQSGTNLVHGSVYEYFRNDALNANDPDLKAVGDGRPVLRRNVFGATLGGPIRKNHAFYFLSYQGTREINGATDQSLYKNVLIAPGLTDDRSETTLLNTFHPALPDLTPAQSIDPVSLQLLHAKLPNGRWLIPTPQQDGRVTGGTVPSPYNEDQFNTDFDFQFGQRDSLSAKFFFANAPQFSALVGGAFGEAAFGGANLPGFGMQIENDNRVLSVSYIHLFGPNTVNEARFGYNFIRNNQLPQEPIRDSDLGIQRTTAENFPGLPLILLAREAQGASVGSPFVSLPGSSSSLSFGDTLSWQHGKHSLRFGGQVIFRRWAVTGNVNSYGEIDFPTFNDFLTGSSDFSVISSGLTNVDFRTTDYNAFVQDDWKVSPKLTLNLGLRYELNMPGYEVQGRMSSFDPALYQPRMEVADGAPVGPPIGGFVLPGNVAPQYDVPGLPKVSRSLLKSVDPNNFGPRIGVSWSPLDSGRLAVRAGYGIFYSRPSFLGLGYGVIGPPFYTTAVSPGQTFANPFPTVVPQNLYPTIQPGILLAGSYLDRNNRTPYFQQFNTSVQYELSRNTTIQAAYVGTRGLRLYRFVGINQAQIATLTRPVVNAVTGEVITTNTWDNAQLRAPMQGVLSNGFALNRTDAQSTYHSLQITLARSMSHGLQFQAAYTFSKSIDNASGPGGGAGSDGSIDTSSGYDTAGILGNQLDARGNRGVSDFDRPQRFVAAYTWDVPQPHFAAHSTAGSWLLANWQVSGIVTLMSGLPIDIVDPAGGTLYGLNGARPNWAPGASRETAMRNIPPGYYFNPYAFSQAIVQPGQPIPSAQDPNALAGHVGTDIGNVGRNALRGPSQSCVDFSLLKRWPIRESSSIEFRADFFNLLNHSNRNNPVSDISIVPATGGSVDPVTGRILIPGDFGRIIGVSSSPRIIQLALKFSF
jgi:outer membrane receptor protein involved in Fe transport